MESSAEFTGRLTSGRGFDGREAAQDWDVGYGEFRCSDAKIASDGCSAGSSLR